MFNDFPFYAQPDTKDCGPTCLRIIAKYYGKYYELQSLREKALISKDGVSMLGLITAAESLGFKAIGAQVGYETLLEGAPLPCIVHWNQNHFVVLYKINKDYVYVSDPARDKLKYKKSDFIEQWAKSETENGDREGLVLLLEPTEAFYAAAGDEKVKVGFKFLAHYLKKYRGLLFQLFLVLTCASVFQLIFPFLTQSLVDRGILQKDIPFIYLVLIGQLVLFAGKTITDIVKNWILLHITSRTNISIISDLFHKLMRLPLSFYDSKISGDILQRVNDHNRIEQFLTGSALNTLFSAISIIVFSIVLASYNVKLFFIFFLGAILYIVWVLLFLKQRRKLDFKRFEVSAQSSHKMIQMISGMQEIKLNNSEQLKRDGWEIVQAKLFKVNIQVLALRQYQQIGAFFINEGKNIFLTFLSATLVINGVISLGTMIAIQYIIGQLNAPIEHFVEFIQSYQDAALSIERIAEIHNQEDEEPAGKTLVHHLPEDKSIHIKELSFQYRSALIKPVLDNISIVIPEGKVTAIVGASGSGKTTLLKLLLKFYTPQKGEIQIGDTNLNLIANQTWRSQCGVVLQDGFIFSDTIANNIAVSEAVPDPIGLQRAASLSNITDFIESLPLGYNTMIGEEGNGISEGQKQRLLIARAIYKDPHYIFFDEATNSLDANNEKIIIENLNEFFKQRTVVIVAHRLSTVKNADQILVMDEGQIVEQGTHQSLSEKRGKYFHLVKNQLELGN